MKDKYNRKCLLFKSLPIVMMIYKTGKVTIFFQLRVSSLIYSMKRVTFIINNFYLRNFFFESVFGKLHAKWL